MEEVSELQEQINALKKQISDLEYQVGDRYRGPKLDDPPQHKYNIDVVNSNNPGYVNRILVATPATGLVRIEWAMARWGQIIPPNWSSVQMTQWMHALFPMQYQVAAAQNIIAREVVAKNFEWLVLLEHDVIPPPDTFKRFNNYMNEKTAPIVSGLCYTRSRPSEPMVYRGRGVSFYSDWKRGDLVWCDGVPTGILLIHGEIIRKMWEEAQPLIIVHPGGRQEETREVFLTPRETFFDPETNQYNVMAGTSDLDWCTKVMKGNFFEKAGWPEHQKMEFPFLVDTNIFCQHINQDGERFP